ncbi:MAG: CcdB family protein [Pseudomonadota bacterium]
MARYAVHDIAEAAGFDSVVLIQADFYDFIDSRLAIPLFHDLGLQIDDLINPVLEVEQKHLLLKTEFLGPFSAHRLGRKVATLDHKSYEIARAVDRLMTGF